MAINDFLKIFDRHIQNAGEEYAWWGSLRASFSGRRQTITIVHGATFIFMSKYGGKCDREGCTVGLLAVRGGWKECNATLWLQCSTRLKSVGYCQCGILGYQGAWMSGWQDANDVIHGPATPPPYLHSIFHITYTSMIWTRYSYKQSKEAG